MQILGQLLRSRHWCLIDQHGDYGHARSIQRERDLLMMDIVGESDTWSILFIHNSEPPWSDHDQYYGTTIERAIDLVSPIARV